MYTDIKEQRGQYWLENIMKDKFAVSMFGQKRLSREGGIEIVVKELCTRMLLVAIISMVMLRLE